MKNKGERREKKEKKKKRGGERRKRSNKVRRTARELKKRGCCETKKKKESNPSPREHRCKKNTLYGTPLSRGEKIDAWKNSETGGGWVSAGKGEGKSPCKPKKQKKSLGLENSGEKQRKFSRSKKNSKREKDR